MVKKITDPLLDPPTASSSDDDDVESSEGEEVSSSEEEDESPDPAIAPSAAAVTIAVPGKTPAAVASAAATTEKQDDSESGSGSETETDSDSESERAPNPGSGKAVAITTVATAKPKQKEAHAQPSAALALPAAKSGTKRPSEGTSRETNAKRAKKVTSGDDEKKTGAFQRKYSEEDEINVLQGMLDFKSDTGKSPYEDTNAFYEFIKDSISYEVNKNKFMDKIRSLKKKYMGNVGKEKNALTKPHDLKSFELSKAIWGPEGIAALESATKSNGVSKKSQSKSSTNKKLDSVKQELVYPSSPNGKEDNGNNKMVVYESVKESDWFEKSFIVSSIAGFGLDEHTVKQKWRLVPKGEKKMIEEKLKALQAKEIEFVLQKTAFLHQVAALISEASKNNGSN